ncbi:MAG: DAK2 domain-containing protein [Candidatus Izimaplasma sp.]|nr:DAK2 domain-containing protein [Candidatus Izimaplasma bacterium]
MNPKTIDGNLFKQLITNGTIALRNDYQRINELNVFPVPDGDTGSNMQSTMMSGVESIRPLVDESVEKVAKVLSRGLLMGARGNSGVILSQLFSGFAKVFKDKETATPKEFIEGFQQGVKQAYGAVINPVEGTILTVAREAADKAATVTADATGLYDVMQVYVKEAYKSLERTPELLDVLKDAGVVDSGGAGFNVIIDGILLALEGEFLEDKKFNTVGSISSSMHEQEEATEFGYCTEFIIELTDGESFDRDNFVNSIERFGDSLVVVNDEAICKVHIHTKTPGDALNYGQQFGEFAKLKIENMTKQHSETLLHTEGEIENVDCGHNHSHYEQPHSKYGLVTVVNGEGLTNTFAEMGVNCIINGGQTMNPSTEDFIAAVEKIDSDEIIIIPNNGNVLLSAEHAAKHIKDKKIYVLPAKTVAQGYASLTMFDANQDIESNLAEMKELIANVKTGEVTHAIRDTKVNGIDISKDNFLGLVDGDIVTCKKSRKDTVVDLFEKMIDDDTEIITIMYGNKVTKDELEDVMLVLESHYPEIEVEAINGHQEVYSYIIAVE